MALVWQPTFGAGSGQYARTTEGIELYVRLVAERGWAVYVGGILSGAAGTVAEAKALASEIGRGVRLASAATKTASAGNSKSAAKTAAMRS